MSDNLESAMNQIQTALSGTSANTEDQTGWNYAQSQYQLMFFFSSDILNLTPNPNDVIGVFKGNVCLGWRYADFTEQYIDVPMMLKDPDLNFNNLTAEECNQAGGIYDNGICTIQLCETTGTCDYPATGTNFYPNCTFKYYNSQSGTISNLINLDANSMLLTTPLISNDFIMLHEYPGIWSIDDSCQISYSLISDQYGYNLVSFPMSLEEGNSLDSFFGINGPVYELIGESIAASLIEGVQWAGSLAVEGIDPKKGYWVKQSNNDTINFSYSGTCLSNYEIYDLHYGNNLISYPNPHPINAIEVLSGKEDVITGIIGQGVAITWHQEYGWIGSLTEFEPGKGYWVKTNTATQFNFTENPVAFSEESMTYLDFDFELTPSTSVDEIFDDLSSKIEEAPEISPRYDKKAIIINRIKKKLKYVG